MFDILVKGGVVMVPITIASMASLAVVIERVLYWLGQRGSVGPEEFVLCAREGRGAEAVKKAGDRTTPVSRVLIAGLKDPVSPGLAMEACAMEEMKDMTRYLPVLDTVVTLGPLLGLLGTIVGMIRSFGVISIAGLGQPQAITGGVAEALIATAAGLSVAIFTLVPYNWLLSKADKTREDMERWGTRLELALCRSAREAKKD